MPKKDDNSLLNLAKDPNHIWKSAELEGISDELKEKCMSTNYEGVEEVDSDEGGLFSIFHRFVLACK